MLLAVAFFCTLYVQGTLVWFLAALFAGHDPRVGSRDVQNSKCHGWGRVGSGSSKSHGSGRVKSFSNLAGRVRAGQEFFKSHGPGQVVSRFSQNSLVRSGRVKRFPNIAGRVRSDQDFFKSHGSGRVGFWSGQDFFKSQVMTRGKRVTHGSGQHDPRVVFC